MLPLCPTLQHTQKPYSNHSNRLRQDLEVVQNISLNSLTNMGARQSSFSSPWKDTVVHTNTSEPLPNTTTTCISTNMLPCIFPPPFTRDLPARLHHTTLITVSTSQPLGALESKTADQQHRSTTTPVSDKVARLIPRDDWRWRHFCRNGKPTDYVWNDGARAAQGAVMENDWYR